MRYYQGFYRLVNPSKYRGNPNNVVYRSSWEKAAFRWFDLNPQVEWFASEEMVIPYVCETDESVHRYFIDIVVKFKNNQMPLAIEIKPKQQLSQPKKSPGKRRARLIEEELTWIKNLSKWHAAEKYCEKRGMKFQIWTEDTLRALGMKIE